MNTLNAVASSTFENSISKEKKTENLTLEIFKRNVPLLSDHWNLININQFKVITPNDDHNSNSFQLDFLNAKFMDEMKPRCTMFGKVNEDLMPFYWFMLNIQSLGFRNDAFNEFVAENNLNNPNFRFIGNANANATATANKDIKTNSINQKWKIVVQKYNDLLKDLRILHSNCLTKDGNLLPEFAELFRNDYYDNPDNVVGLNHSNCEQYELKDQNPNPFLNFRDSDDENDHEDKDNFEKSNNSGDDNNEGDNNSSSESDNDNNNNNDNESDNDLTPYRTFGQQSEDENEYEGDDSNDE